MPDALPSSSLPSQESPANFGASTEPEIFVIPEKFYGAALKARAQEQPTQKPAETSAAASPPRSKKLVILIMVSGFLVAVLAGSVVFMNRQSLFGKKSAPQPVVQEPPPQPQPPPPLPPPAAPTELTATSTNPQSVSLTWRDDATNESGYRIERAESITPFQGLTSLPPGSVLFLDTSVRPGTSYRYRVIALNDNGESPSTDVSVNTTSLLPPPPEQPKLPPAGLDTDSDGLTDLEEALFATDLKNPDTDNDGFLDGNEVFHLYNPNGRAPARLLDAKLVKVIFTSVGWSMQLPLSWSMTMLEADGSRVAISSGHGETFTVSVEQNPKLLPIVDWYLGQHPDVQASQVLQYRSKRGYQGVIGADLLTTYIPWGDRVFVFMYTLNNQTFINYRTTYSMALNSLELKGLPQIKPPVAGAPLPFEPAATATGIIALPVSISVATSSSPVTSTSFVATTSAPVLKSATSSAGGPSSVSATPTRQ